MYMPENNAQLFDILATLRIYAAMNAFPDLAEALDDALVLVAAEVEPAPRVLSSTGLDLV